MTRRKSARSEPRQQATPILALLYSSEARLRLLSAAHGSQIKLFASSRELLDAVASENRTDLVVIEAVDAGGRSMASVVAALRERHPSIPVLAYCGLAPATSAILLEVARAGATGLVLRGVDDIGIAMRTAINQARHGCVAQRVYGALAPHLTPELRTVLRYAISRAADEPTVDDAARSLGIDRKTLLNWCRRSSPMRPREFINWVRLAIGVGMLSDPARTAEQVALDLGYSSGTAFRNMLQRYAGCSSSVMRGADGLETLLRVFWEHYLPAKLVAPAPEEDAVERIGRSA